MLYERLVEEGYRVERSEFHRYDTPTGELIMKWLAKEWDADQHTIELIMAADKQAQQGWINQLEEDGVDFLILDRYTGSQEVYSAAQGISPIWTKRLLQHVRQPNLEVIIDIPAQESMKRKGKHNNGENDRYESDLSLLQSVRSGYLRRCAEMDPVALLVSGLQTPEEVHEDIYGAFAYAVFHRERG